MDNIPFDSKCCDNGGGDDQNENDNNQEGGKGNWNKCKNNVNDN